MLPTKPRYLMLMAAPQFLAPARFKGSFGNSKTDSPPGRGQTPKKWLQAKGMPQMHYGLRRPKAAFH